MLHLYATGRLTFYTSITTYPAWTLFTLLVSPFWRELHFFVYHWLLHQPLLYKRFHGNVHAVGAENVRCNLCWQPTTTCHTIQPHGVDCRCILSSPSPTSPGQ